MVRSSALLLLFIVDTATFQAFAGESCGNHDSHALEGCMDTEEANSFLQLTMQSKRFDKSAELQSQEPDDIFDTFMSSIGSTTKAPTALDFKGVDPLKCDKISGPMVITTAPLFADDPRPVNARILEVDVQSGNTSVIWTLPRDLSSPTWQDIDGCGINPLDFKLYCYLFAGGGGIQADGMKPYVVRMDNDTIEFVAVLPSAKYKAAGFGPSGTFYLGTETSSLIAVENLTTTPGFVNIVNLTLSQNLLDLRNVSLKQPKGWPDGFSSDLVVVKNYFGDKPDDPEYIVSPYRDKLRVARYDVVKKKFTGSWALDLAFSLMKPVDLDISAQFKFEGDPYFVASKDSASRTSIYRIPINTVNLTSNETVYVEEVGQFTAFEKQLPLQNDGFACPGATSPFPAQEESLQERTPPE